MRGIELATGLVIGVDRSRAPLRPRPVAPAELAGVLEQALVPALQRAPCVVAFSGGRDSSGLLAAATRAARRHGLPLPIPASYGFPGLEDMDESAWQDSVVRHLDLEDWVRVAVTDELDLVGPVAGPLLRRFGPLWPPNSHFGGLLVPHARGGTFVTGVGGDELLEPGGPPRGSSCWPADGGHARGISDPWRPRWLHGRYVSGEHAGTVTPSHGWRRMLPRHTCERALAKTREPLWWGRSVAEGWWRSRQRLALTASIAAACGEDVQVAHPFMEPTFLGAVAGALWRTGFPSRAAAMDLLFGEALPQAVRQRSSKAAFFAPFVNRHSRAFIRSWDGTGVDETLVDVQALQACWDEARVDARSYALLQSAWLAAGTDARIDAVATPSL